VGVQVTTGAEGSVLPRGAQIDSSIKAILVNFPQNEHPAGWDALLAAGVDIEAVFPDARSAIDSIRLSQSEERLCVMRVTSAEQAQQLKLLSENFVGRPVMALVDANSSVELVFAANRAGAAQVLPLPLEGEDLKAALRSIKLHHTSPQPVAARRVIAVSGVTGGCGATAIAINLAYEIGHQLDLTCLLTEFSTLGMIATCLDVEGGRTTHDLLFNMGTVDVQMAEKALSQISDRLRVLPAPFHDTEPLAATPADVIRLIDLLKQLADVVVVDLPISHRDFFDLLPAVDQVVLVAEQAVPSLRALGYAREILGEAEGLRQTLLINRYDPNKEGFAVNHLQRLLRTPQLVTVANDYHAVSAALNEGRPLRVHAPASRALADISRLATMLITPVQGMVPPPARPSGGLFSLLRNLFRGRKS
jgi:pilus assembly protein CpaE